jgi:DNA-binding transcriptional MerR regulator
MDELIERVHRALAGEYPGAPNGRVRDLPDRRAIRWYTTTGLVDRPAGLRGRVALYGPRHLLQIVALKRRQAEGRSLAEIQAELGGAPDQVLADVARVPDAVLVLDGPPPDRYETAVRDRFWAARPAAAAADQPEAAPEADRCEAAADQAEAPAAADRHEAAPAATGPVADAGVDVAGGAVPVGGVALPGGAILMLPGVPTATDLPAIAAAAAPLLDLLAQRGLLTGEPLNDRRTP